ncbi:nucleotidyltransferase family protein [Pseudohoeflea coraliihabitans]|uniref:Nucleotidyltransferase-like domain-containing protein n=1 Tax=Pseudohoeflea coraliihabitans TaxID=2860393 RepID=A0ABS6WNI7_9HYPH|nr:GSU2403 family nucleotidyltransferase fold protein [Pseudohoeflea sp. DP4N28-3]MBW3097523.1 hypothetical protein [Pseudohoeflea sp. DP4N28-3]
MPDISHHSQIALAAYHDLLRNLQDERAAEIVGTPTRVTVKNRIFWYDKYRVGTDMAQRYIGPDSEALRQRFERLDGLKAEAERRRAERTRLVRILRAEGFAPLDAKTGSLLSAFARVGVFRSGGTLIGTVAFRHYEGELGVRLGFDQLAQTGGIDVGSFERLSFAIGDSVSEPLEKVFSELKFRPMPALERGRVWRWEQTSGETLVEFLMPAHGEEGIRELPALGVSAQALHHLDYLLADPIPAISLYRSGVLVQIPRPERFAIHKLIVAERRQGGADDLKARKDRAQADFLISALAELRPDELREAHAEAEERGPRWRERIAASLERLPDAARHLREIAR